MNSNVNKVYEYILFINIYNLFNNRCLKIS